MTALPQVSTHEKFVTKELRIHFVWNVKVVVCMMNWCLALGCHSKHSLKYLIFETSVKENYLGRYALCNYNLYVTYIYSLWIKQIYLLELNFESFHVQQACMGGSSPARVPSLHNSDVLATIYLLSGRQSKLACRYTCLGLYKHTQPRPRPGLQEKYNGCPILTSIRGDTRPSF